MKTIGNGGKGIDWNTDAELTLLAQLNHTVLEEGETKGLPKIDTDIDAAEVILVLAPETNLDEAYQEKPVTFGNENPCVNCKS